MRTKWFILVIALLGLVSTTGATTVFHCDPNPEYCGFERNFENTKAKFKDINNTSERKQMKTKLLEKISETDKRTERLELQKKYRKLENRSRKYYQLRRKIDQMQEFYKYSINSSEINYTQDKKPVKVNPRNNDYWYTNFYPIENYSRKALKFREGCLETKVGRPPGTDFYGVNWQPTSEPWHCIFGKNIFSKPLEIIKIFSIKL